MREDEALRLLGTAQRAHRDAIARKEKLLSDREASLLRRELLGSQITHAPAFVTEELYLAGLKQKVMQADHAVTRAARGVEKALQAYLHAKRQLMIIEKLKERDLQSFKLSEAKRELKEMNDLYVMRSSLQTLNGLQAMSEEGSVGESEGERG
jgi:flagellar export protein FliJ